jgi:hypothetical protein
MEGSFTVSLQIWLVGLTLFKRERVSFQLCDLPRIPPQVYSFPGIPPQIYYFPGSFSHIDSFPGLPPQVPTKITAAWRGQMRRSSETRFESATFRLTVMYPTSLGKMVDVVECYLVHMEFTSYPWSKSCALYLVQ